MRYLWDTTAEPVDKPGLGEIYKYHFIQLLGKRVDCVGRQITFHSLALVQGWLALEHLGR
jgi:hypothetical protein